MKNTLILLSILGICTSAFAQMQLDNKIQLTGSGSSAKIEGIDEIVNNSDAANKIYVDTAIANRAGGSGVNTLVDEYTIDCNGPMQVHTGISGSTTWKTTNSSTSSSSNRVDGRVNTGSQTSGHNASMTCQNATYGGHTDWYLPAYAEAMCIYDNGFVHGAGISNYYWTSTETSATEAGVIDVNGGILKSRSKTESWYVWCVRRP